MAEAFADFTGFRHIVDSIVIYGSDLQQHISLVKQILQ